MSPGGSGCEVNLTSSASNCGSCGDACTDGQAGQSAACVDEACVYTTCDPGLGDCNGNGACTDDLSQTNNCGSCGTTCSVANGTPNCDGTDCGIAACDSSAGETWADCDDSYVSGCEVNTETNKFHCGGCNPDAPAPGAGTNCTDITSDLSKQVEEVGCDATACTIVTCKPNFADCNGIFADGCEVDVTSNKDHCGGCTSGPTTTWDGGFLCDSLYANGSGACNSGSCEFDECDSNYGDCNNDAEDGPSGDGCEVDLVGNDAHCGACDNACTVNAATSGNSCTAMSNRACAPTCSDNDLYGNCDSNGANGCETQLQSTATSCGTCNNDCTASVGSDNISGVECASAACEVTGCNSNRADCNGNFGDGCEVNTNNSEAHCGGCAGAGGQNCNAAIGSQNVTGVTCSAGDCEVSACSSANRQSCDDDFSTGCETNTNTDLQHCGDCDTPCANKTSATTSCSGGNCSWMCLSGSKDTNGDLNNATSNGCESYIIAEASGTPGTTTVLTGGTNGDLSVPHTLLTSRSTNPRRAVVALIGLDGHNVDLPPGVTYDGTAMTPAIAAHSSNSVWSAIYYILDADLPTNGGSYNLNIDGNQYNQFGWAVEIMELVNVNQTTPVSDSDSVSGSGTGAGTVSLTGLPADSWLFSTTSTFGTTNFSSSSGLTYLTEHAPNGGRETISGYETEISGSQSSSWTTSGNVNSWVHVAAAFSPATN